MVPKHSLTICQLVTIHIGVALVVLQLKGRTVNTSGVETLMRGGGFKHRLDNYRDTGIFMKKWIKQPFLWLLHYGDTKVAGYDFDEINQQRIAMFPTEVQEAICGEGSDNRT